MNHLPDKSLLPILNLDVELFERNNLSIAFLVVISGLIKNIDQRPEILEKVKPGYINVRFNRYLYEVVAGELERTQEVSIETIIERVPDFGPLVYDTQSTERDLYGNYYTVAQVLDFQPTSRQISKAIDMIANYAKRKGYAPY